MTISDELIRKHLRPYGFAPTSEQVAKFRSYADLLIAWNKKISLTTIVEPVEMVRTHFGESIFGRTSGLISEGRLADVGSGAGFPGIPLAITTSELQVTLIEPSLKKVVFLSEVKRELQLENVRIVRGSMSVVDAGEFDYITSRALGRFADFLQFASRHTLDEGRAVLWLGEAAATEIAQVSSWRWHSARSIPLSDRRCILVGEKINE
jgi:16S rRNA (guanine527-N7)-methyltransferase